MPRPTAVSNDLLQAALSGLELQRQRIDAHMAQIRGMLGVRRGRPPKSEPAVSPSAETAPRKKRSAAARARMAEAQRKRWAKLKGVQPTEPEKPARKKRRISAEGRKRIAEAARKRWAAVKKANEAA